MKHLLQILNNWWFPKLPPQRIALIRAATGAYTLWYLIMRIDLLAAVARTDHNLFEPISAIQLLNAPLPPAVFDTLVWITLGLNFCFILGFAHRLTGPLFAALLYFVLCYRNSWSMIYHSHNVLVFHVVILGMLRSADVCSWDSWWRQRKAPTHTIEPSERYGWPLQLMCTVTLASYFLAGLAKVSTPAGFNWAMGAALRDQVGVDALRKEVLGSEPGMLAHYLFEHLWIFTMMGIATLIVELGAPLVITNRRLGKIWCLATFGMHWGIFFIMGIRFRYQLSGMMFLSFFNIERLLGKQFSTKTSPPEAPQTSSQDVTARATRSLAVE